MIELANHLPNRFEIFGEILGYIKTEQPTVVIYTYKATGNIYNEGTDSSQKNFQSFIFVFFCSAVHKRIYLS